MRRREFIALAAAAASWPGAATAQQPGAMRRLGILMGGRGADDPEGQERLATVKRGLQELGWREGDNLHIDMRWAGGDGERIRAQAMELVALAPEVILANSTPAVAALAKATKAIPIVVAQIVDPVGLGFVESLARPGGNITGFSFIDLTLVRKWPETLKEIAPGVTRASLLHHPDNTPFYPAFVRSLADEGLASAVPITVTTVRTLAELERVIAGLGAEPGNGLVIPPDPFNGANRKVIIRLAERFKLPAVSVYRQYAFDGGLMAYGPDSTDIFWRSTSYVDRILRGASPADLPVQAPTKFELIVNAKAAKTLGLDVPASLLARADEVIE